ncbi:MAG: hypothetical protein E6G80_17330 [Alphaproteobacteria bacterium]|nr:MAG: hypothetical protein E6G80_17330 [Alphaproteobacteria bacterium]
MASRVQIHIAPDCPRFPERIELSSGTRLANAQEMTTLVGGFAYEQGSRLPREPWRRPTEEETASLIATELPRDMSTAVSIIKLPGEFSDSARDAIRTAENEDFLAPLRATCDFGEPVHCIGTGENLPGLKTVTVNHERGEYIGMHVDTWDEYDVQSLHFATNRICINIGWNARYFLFLPYSVADVACLLAEELGLGWEIPARHTEIGRQFMARFPDVPVVRCLLAPGEAYIAPTENLFHDGSSLGQSHKDEVFTVRGRIRPI